MANAIVIAVVGILIVLVVLLARSHRQIMSYKRAHARYRLMLAELNIHLGEPKTWHDLKCHPPYFDNVYRGVKPFDVRYNDRKFMPGDGIRMREFTPSNNQYTGRTVCVFIVAVYPFLIGVRDGYVVLALRLIAPPLE